MVDLIGKKYYFFGLSILIIIAGIVGYFVHGGFNLDIQFQGGTVMEIQMKDDKFDANKVQEHVSKAIGKQISAQKSQTLDAAKSNKEINMLIVSVPGKGSLTQAQRASVVDEVYKLYEVQPGQMPNVNDINPTFGKEIFIKGLEALAVISLLIILYVWIRFKIMSGLSAGVTAVIGLIHDALIMLTVYSVFNIRMNESFIAAVLTIIGYSMNDTIIIYDRIRENSGLLKKVPISELVNRSILQTLSRSINTVVTVLICCITLYVFSVYYNIESVKEFSFPLIIGVASGCYSSIFIASPLFVMWKESQQNKKIAPKSSKV